MIPPPLPINPKLTTTPYLNLATFESARRKEIYQFAVFFQLSELKKMMIKIDVLIAVTLSIFLCGIDVDDAEIEN